MVAVRKREDEILIILYKLWPGKRFIIFYDDDQQGGGGDHFWMADRGKWGNEKLIIKILCVSDVFSLHYYSVLLFFFLKKFIALLLRRTKKGGLRNFLSWDPIPNKKNA